MIMRSNARLAPVIGLSLLAVSVGVFVAGSGEAHPWGGGQKVREKVVKLAAAIKAGDKAAIKEQTAALAKHDLDEVMDAFKPRSIGGLGVGKKGTITPDGIELKIRSLARDTIGAAALAKETEALEEMSYVISAITEVALVKGPPPKSKGQKSDWQTWSQEVKDAANGFRKALQAKSGPELKTAANKMNNGCTACHAAFKTN